MLLTAAHSPLADEAATIAKTYRLNEGVHFRS
jgi:hypothetical protein